MQISKPLRAGWLVRLRARACCLRSKLRRHKTARQAGGASLKTVSRTTQRLKPSLIGHAILERNSGFIAVYYPVDVHSLLMTLYTRDGNQPRLRAKGFGENPASITFVFQDITNWKKGTEHINGLELFFKDRDHLIEKWETLNPDGTKARFEFELTRKGGPDR